MAYNQNYGNQNGGYQQPPQGGYNPPQGNYQQPPQGGYAPPRGGYQQPPQGNYQQPPQNGYNGNQQGNQQNNGNGQNKPYPHTNFLYRPNGKDSPMSDWVMTIEGYAKSITVRDVNTANGPRTIVDLTLSSIMTDKRVAFLFGEQYISEFGSVTFRVACWDRNGEFLIKNPPQKNQKVLVMVRGLKHNEFTGQNGVVYRSIQCTAIEAPRTNSRREEKREFIVPDDRRNGGAQNNGGYGHQQGFGSYGNQQPPQGNYNQQSQAQPQKNYQQPQGSYEQPPQQQGYSNDPVSQLGGAFRELQDNEEPFDDGELPF